MTHVDGIDVFFIEEGKLAQASNFDLEDGSSYLEI